MERARGLFNVALVIVALISISTVTVVVGTQTATTFESQINEASSKASLFELWQSAKHNLALSGKVLTHVRIRDFLKLGDKPGDDHDREVFEKLEIDEIRTRMKSALLQSPFLDSILDSGASDRAWGGWFETDGGRLDSHQEMVDLVCKSADKIEQAPSEVLLLASQFLLFDDDFQCDKLVAMDPILLLEEAIASKQGDASIKAEILMHGLTLVQDYLNSTENMMDRIDNIQDTSNSEVGEEISESGRLALDSLLEIAFKTNHPLAHLALARYFGTRPLSGGSTNMEIRDCDRAGAHLIKALHSVEPLVENLMTGSLDRPENRASFLHSTGDLDEPSLFFAGFRSEDDFVEHELHLQELARGLAADEDQVNDGQLDLQLGDLYYFGAPEVGVHPQLHLAEQMYRRAMRYGNGAAASQLATMLLNNEASLNGRFHSANEDEYSEEEQYDQKELKEEDDELNDNLSDEEYERARNTTAFQLYKQAAEWGDGLGYVGLGIYFEHGHSPHLAPRDIPRAIQLYDLAAQRGLSEGDYRAGRLYLTDATILNVTLGLARMEKAAKQGHVAASYELGYALIYGDWSRGGCQRAVTWLTKAIRSDWTREIPFDLMKGLRTLSRGKRDDVALRIFMTSHVLLWQDHALLNAAFVMERGHLPQFDQNASFLSLTSKHARSPLHETLVSLAQWTGFQARWPCHWRWDKEGQARAEMTRDLYAFAIAQVPNDGEARRKLGECLMEGWKGACPEKDVPRAIWNFRKAADLGDAESLWRLAMWKGLGTHLTVVGKNITRAYEDLERVVELDPYASFVVELSRLFLFVASWFDS